MSDVKKSDPVKGPLTLKRYGTNCVYFCITVATFCALFILPIDLWSTTEHKADISRYFYTQLFANASLFALLVCGFVTITVLVINLLPYTEKLFTCSIGFLKEGCNSLDGPCLVLIVIFLITRIYLTSHITLMFYFVDDEMGPFFNQTIGQIEMVLIFTLGNIEGFMFLYMSFYFNMILALYQSELLHLKRIQSLVKVNRWQMMFDSFIVVSRFHLGTIGYGAIFLPPLMLFSFFKNIFCSSKKGSEVITDAESAKTCCNCSNIPTYSERLFFVCAIKGTNFCESAKEDSRLLPTEVLKKIALSDLWLLLIRVGIIVVTSVIVIKLVQVDEKVFGIFTYIIIGDAVIELTTFCTTNAWTKLIYFFSVRDSDGDSAIKPEQIFESPGLTVLLSDVAGKADKSNEVVTSTIDDGKL